MLDPRVPPASMTAALGEISPGTHACLVTTSTMDHRTVVTKFVRDGIAAGERVCYIVDGPTPTPVIHFLERMGVAVEEHVGQGQLVFFTAEEAYLPDGVFEPARMIDGLVASVAGALAEGWAGFRATGEMSWATTPSPGVEQLLEYEDQVGAVFAAGLAFTGLCQYDARLIDPAAIPAYAGVHGHIVGEHAYADHSARVTALRSGAGLRIAGELDDSNADVVTRAIAPFLPRGGVVHLDLSGLLFIGVGAADLLIAAAEEALQNGRLVVHDPPPSLRRMLTARLWGSLPDTLAITA